MKRRDFLKSVGAVVAGCVVGFGSQEVPAAAMKTAQQLLLPMKDVAYFEGWAAKVFKVYRVDPTQMLGPEWWMTDTELAELRAKEATP